MTDQTAIHTEGLTKHYGDVKALVDLDLSIEPGEVFGFLGPNGAGKTTMIRTILDEIRPTTGRASILGMDTHEQSVEIRRHIGYVIQQIGLLEMNPVFQMSDALKGLATSDPLFAGTLSALDYTGFGAEGDWEDPENWTLEPKTGTFARVRHPNPEEAADEVVEEIRQKHKK